MYGFWTILSSTCTVSEQFYLLDVRFLNISFSWNSSVNQSMSIYLFIFFYSPSYGVNCRSYSFNHFLFKQVTSYQVIMGLICYVYGQISSIIFHNKWLKKFIYRYDITEQIKSILNAYKYRHLSKSCLNLNTTNLSTILINTKIFDY